MRVERVGGSRGARPLLAAFFSLLLPGAGHLYLGRRRLGLALIAVSLAMALGAVWVWLRGPGELLRLAVQPGVLLWLLAADFVLLAFRLVTVADAYLVGRASARRSRVLPWAVLPLLVALTAAPHVVVASYDIRAYDLLTLFAAEQTAEPLLAVYGDDPDPHSRVAPPPFWEERKRITILLVGGDAGPGRSGLRTDSMMVASIDPRSRRTALFGVPRNLIDVPLSSGGTYDEPLNALYGDSRLFGAEYPRGKDPGAQALKGALSELLGLRIDHYALVDMRGFVGVVDALGGVTVRLRYGLRGRFSTASSGQHDVRLNLGPGEHHLDGRAALAYARTRSADSDYQRMRRQRCLLGSLVREASFPKLLGAFPKLVRVLKRHVDTDVPLRFLPDLIDLATDVRAGRVATVGFTPPAYADLKEEQPGYYVPRTGLIRWTVQETFRRPPGEIGVATIRADC